MCNTQKSMKKTDWLKVKPKIDNLDPIHFLSIEIYFLYVVEYIEKIQRDAAELATIFSSPRSPPPSYESDMTEDSLATSTTTDYSSPAPRQ